MGLLLRSGMEYMEKGLDYVRRGDLIGASESFNSAATKFRKEGQIAAATAAQVYAQLVQIRPDYASPDSLRQLATYVGQLGTYVVQIGTVAITAQDLATQLELKSRERQVEMELRSSGYDPLTKSIALQTLSDDYARLGETILFLPEFFQGQSVPASAKVPVLSAQSEELAGLGLQKTDPLTAAAHFQSAQLWWQQAGDNERAEVAGKRAGSLSFRAKCWFCGREGSGHGIQFVSLQLENDVTSLGRSEEAGLPSVGPTGSVVYACKGCYAGLSVVAASIADRKVAEVEQRLSYQIMALKNSIGRGN